MRNDESDHQAQKPEHFEIHPERQREVEGDVKINNTHGCEKQSQGQIEAIDYISDFLTPEEYQGYLRGNIAKYLHRWPYKNGTEDLKKAAWYLDRLIKEQEK